MSANEKKLTIEETIRKMNDISKGAISKFKDYRFKDTNGDIRTIDDIIGMKKAASLRPDMKKAPCGADFVMVNGRCCVSPALHGLSATVGRASHGLHWLC